ncbi:hypothetical protein FN976_20530 [Caenimonas sedimenti]|uniref:PIN-like domain-containing protein n=1 Tax=Caenimonas sedimenti TaxID=2596921 RepID=A0A562ZLS1_9BURK|nr:PIN domain-containing protein [Caenimonas sedimenti]TWO69124.1 hypothetical protein FN976_20530 [Caenimonas sedimenti]
MIQFMAHTLLLLDYENVPKVDLSVLDEGFRAVIFVGRNQEPPRASKSKQNAHRFARVDFQKIDGMGKNALDFHIAFHLGRLFETSPETECIVIAKDKGYDPLLAHLNKNGMKCRRVASWDDLVAARTGSDSTPKVDGSSAQVGAAIEVPIAELTVCSRCKKASTIEHHGGRWCTNCGRFAAPPDPALLPSAKMKQGSGSLAWGRTTARVTPESERELPECGWCNRRSDMTGGIFDDGEWMCGHCVARYAT